MLRMNMGAEKAGWGAYNEELQIARQALSDIE